MPDLVVTASARRSPDPVEAVDVVPQGLSQGVGVHTFMHGHPVVGHVAHNLQ